MFGKKDRTGPSRVAAAKAQASRRVSETATKVAHDERAVRAGKADDAKLKDWYKGTKDLKRHTAIAAGYESGRAERTLGRIKAIAKDRAKTKIVGKSLRGALVGSALSLAAGAIAVNHGKSKKTETAKAKTAGKDRTAAYTDSKGRVYANGRAITRKATA